MVQRRPFFNRQYPHDDRVLAAQTLLVPLVFPSTPLLSVSVALASWKYWTDKRPLTFALDVLVSSLFVLTHVRQALLRNRCSLVPLLGVGIIAFVWSSELGRAQKRQVVQHTVFRMAFLLALL